MNRFVAALLAALAIGAAGAAVGPTSPAHAANGCNTQFQFISSGYYITVENASVDAGARLVQRRSHADGPELYWCVTEGSGGAHRIYNRKSGLCMTTDGIAGHWLTQERCDSRWGQAWTVINLGEDYVGFFAYRIDSWFYPLTVEVYGNSDREGAVIDAWHRNGGANQLVYKWVHKPIDHPQRMRA